jgi:hypothetical protein
MICIVKGKMAISNYFLNCHRGIAGFKPALLGTGGRHSFFQYFPLESRLTGSSVKSFTTFRKNSQLALVIAVSME